MKGNQYNKGKRNRYSHTDEAKEAISASRRGRPMSDETKQKLREAAIKRNSKVII